MKFQQFPAQKFRTLLLQLVPLTLFFGIFSSSALASDVFTKLDESLKPCTSNITYCVYIPVRPVFDLDNRKIGIKVSHAALGQIVGGMEKYLKRTKYNENLLHNFSYTPLEKGMRIDFSYQEKSFSDAIGGGVTKTGESNWDMMGTLSNFSFDGEGNLLYTPQFIVKDAHSSGVNIATRELVIGEVAGFLSERFGPRLTLSQAFLNFGALIFNFHSVFNDSKLDVSPLVNQLKEKNIKLNSVTFDQYGLTLAGTFSDQLINNELDAMTDLLVDIIVNSMNNSNIPVRNELINDLRNQVRSTLAKQIPGYAVPAAELESSLNLIASGKSSYASEISRLKKLPLRTLPLPISVRMKGRTSAAINETVATKIFGGKAPYRYELIQGPSTYNYFSFDASTGNFLFQPKDLFSTQTISYRVIDSLNQQATGLVTIAFDYSDIAPGHPPIDQPQPTLPVAINAIFTVTADQSSDSRRLDGTNGETADLLKVTGGNVKIEAEAFLENLDDSYTGTLDCKVDWKGVNAKSSTLKNNDGAPRNFFAQQTISAATLQANEVTTFRLSCTAPNAPSVVRDIPVSYLASTFMCQYKHKKDTAGGKSGAITTLDAFGKTKSCDKNGDWKTSCKDGNGDTDEVGCDDKRDAPPPANNVFFCQYKHKKDTSGGQNGQTTSFDVFGKTKSCDKNADWKTSCKDGNGDTEEVGCDLKIESPLPGNTASMCQYKHKKDTAGGKNGQVTGLDAFGKSKTCDKNGDWKTSCKDGNGDTDEVACQ